MRATLRRRPWRRKAIVQALTSARAAVGGPGVAREPARTRQRRVWNRGRSVETLLRAHRSPPAVRRPRLRRRSPAAWLGLLDLASTLALRAGPPRRPATAIREPQHEIARGFRDVDAQPDAHVFGAYLVASRSRWRRRRRPATGCSSRLRGGGSWTSAAGPATTSELLPSSSRRRDRWLGSTAAGRSCERRARRWRSPVRNSS